MSNDQLSMFEGEAELPPKSAKAKPLNLSISRTIVAPAEKIFDRWLIPVFVGNWMFGPNVGNEKVLDLQNEVRPGGTFRYKIQRGGKEFIYSGEYQLIDRPKRLKFSWQENNTPAGNVSVSLEQIEDKTKLKVSLQVDRSLAEHVELIKRQWTDRCKALSCELSK
ncbi:MAG: SRPBCC domain-containing protein [Pseudohongiella sp.]|nr:SRPBCC domain-containing protein [Pseudohongiella sp.]